MLEAQSAPLEAGVAVQFADSDLMVRGVVVEVLPLGYVRVLWNDGFIPTTHRMHSLERSVHDADIVDVARLVGA